MSSLGNRGEAVDLFIEAVEAAVHSILFVRGVYPKNTFERRQMYGASVFQSRHPALCDYVGSVLANARPLFLEGAAERIVVFIMKGAEEVIEQYVFEVTQLGAAVGEAVCDSVDEDTLLYDTESQLRDLLLRTLALGWQLGPITGGVCFQMRVHLREDKTESSRHALQTGCWNLASESERQQGNSGSITPLRSVISPALNFQLYAAH